MNCDNFIDYSYSRVGQDVRYSIDTSKLKQLGWKPKKVFDQEIYKVVRYYKNEYEW